MDYMDKDTQISKIKDKLKKLMAKEESARELGNQAEADAFASKINQLLIDYELEIEEIQGQNRIYGVDEEIIDTSGLTLRNESDWVRRLYDACAVTNFCKVLLRSDNLYYVVLIGDETNREFVHYMVHQLISKIRTLARKEYSNYKANGGFHKRNTYIRSFLKGACDSIKHRLLKDMDTQKANNDQVHGLVLAKDRALIDFIKKHYPFAGKMDLQNGSSTDGYYAGQRAGRDVSINQGVNQGYGGQKLLG